MHVYRHDSQELNGENNTNIHQWMSKQIVVYTNTGILFNHKGNKGISGSLLHYLQ